MSQENVEIVGRLIDAFNERDIDRFAEVTTSDFEWSPSMVAIEGEVFVGRDGIETYGVPVDAPITNVLDFRGGRIWRSRAYFDRAEALRAAGLAE